MTSIADQLPPEIAAQIHPDRRKNEAAYWAARDQLLEHYRDKWVGFAEGKVVASGGSPVTVFHQAEATGLHPFFVCVGREQEPCRIRRATSPYDPSYPGEALPRLLGGIAGGSAASLTFQTWARLDGQDYPCRLYADFSGGERILGRDVLNRLEILFRGPAGEVVVNP